MSTCTHVAGVRGVHKIYPWCYNYSTVDNVGAIPEIKNKRCISDVVISIKKKKENNNNNNNNNNSKNNY